MTDIEIDKALALAIGWKESDIVTSHLYSKILVWVGLTEEFPTGWRHFSHQDWNVIGPIGERYDCFPVESVGKKQWASWVDGPVTYADTPRKAIALAVIGAKK